MKKLTEIVVTIVLISVILLGISIWKGWWRPLSVSSEWEYKGIVVENEHDYNQNPDIIQLENGCYRMYTHGNRKGIEENNIFSFYSCDGMKWEFEGMRIESAAMPAAIIVNGKTRIYFQRGIEREGKPEQALMVAESEDGLTFGEPKKLLETGLGELKDIITISHFDIVKTENGYRIYFDEGGKLMKDVPGFEKTGWLWPVTRVRSLFSVDGFNWTLEEGARIDYTQGFLKKGGGTASVVKLDDGYHIFFVAGFSPWEEWEPWSRKEWSGIYEGVSKDGLNFELIDKRISTGTDPKAVRKGNVLWLYVSRETENRRGHNLIELLEKKL
ncbi:MAG: hypothetical protein QXD43_00955 [Candidatus Aenigmatarchaeota archaeon]